jgi:hypothetical protein
VGDLNNPMAPDGHLPAATKGAQYLFQRQRRDPNKNALSRDFLSSWADAISMLGTHDPREAHGQSRRREPVRRLGP